MQRRVGFILPSVYTTHQQQVHSSSTGFCCSETPYKDVINMLKARKTNKWKKRGCAPDGRGSKDKKMEKQASGNKKNGEFQQRLKTRDISMCGTVDKPSSNTNWQSNKTSWTCVLGFLFLLETIKEIDLLSHPLTPKNERINSSEA